MRGAPFFKLIKFRNYFLYYSARSSTADCAKSTKRFFIKILLSTYMFFVFNIFIIEFQALLGYNKEYII